MSEGVAATGSADLGRVTMLYLCMEAAGGVLTLWVAFHGIGGVHDRQVNCRGAYAGTCQAIECAHAARLSVGCNVFLTTESLPQLDELIATVGRLVDGGTCFETASYLPTPRSRRNERLRLTLPQLAPVGPVDTDMMRGSDIPKASPESVARANFDAVDNGEEEIFPDPTSALMAAEWRDGAAKVLERQLAQVAPVSS